MRLYETIDAINAAIPSDKKAPKECKKEHENIKFWALYAKTQRLCQLAGRAGEAARLGLSQPVIDALTALNALDENSFSAFVTSLEANRVVANRAALPFLRSNLQKTFPQQSVDIEEGSQTFLLEKVQEELATLKTKTTAKKYKQYAASLERDIKLVLVEPAVKIQYEAKGMQPLITKVIGMARAFTCKVDGVVSTPADPSPVDGLSYPEGLNSIRLADQLTEFEGTATLEQIPVFFQQLDVFRTRYNDTLVTERAARLERPVVDREKITAAEKDALSNLTKLNSFQQQLIDTFVRDAKQMAQQSVIDVVEIFDYRDLKNELKVALGDLKDGKYNDANAPLPMFEQLLKEIIKTMDQVREIDQNVVDAGDYQKQTLDRFAQLYFVIKERQQSIITDPERGTGYPYSELLKVLTTFETKIEKVSSKLIGSRISSVSDVFELRRIAWEIKNNQEHGKNYDQELREVSEDLFDAISSHLKDTSFEMRNIEQQLSDFAKLVCQRAQSNESKKSKKICRVYSKQLLAIADASSGETKVIINSAFAQENTAASSGSLDQALTTGYTGAFFQFTKNNQQASKALRKELSFLNKLDQFSDLISERYLAFDISQDPLQFKQPLWHCVQGSLNTLKDTTAFNIFQDAVLHHARLKHTVTQTEKITPRSQAVIDAAKNAVKNNQTTYDTAVATFNSVDVFSDSVRQEIMDSRVIAEALTMVRDDDKNLKGKYYKNLSAYIEGAKPYMSEKNLLRLALLKYEQGLRSYQQKKPHEQKLDAADSIKTALTIMVEGLGAKNSDGDYQSTEVVLDKFLTYMWEANTELYHFDKEHSGKVRRVFERADHQQGLRGLVEGALTEVLDGLPAERRASFEIKHKQLIEDYQAGKDVPAEEKKFTLNYKN